MTDVKLMLGNCLDRLKDLDDNSVDSIVTDPPYGIDFMGKKWDYDVPSTEIWEQAIRVLKPGGYLLAFAGTRTQHRMAVRIEDAGFEIRDMIAWVYGSGFPKAHDIGKSIDKGMGKQDPNYGSSNNNSSSGGTNVSEMFGKEMGGRRCKKCKKDTSAQYECKEQDCGMTYSPQTDLGHKWSGWKTALKPALEPITVARKPLEEKTVAKNVLKYGTGGMNIDASRIPTNPDVDDARLGGNGSWKTDKASANVGHGSIKGDNISSSDQGRFPANLIHDGSEEVLDLFPYTKSGRSNGNATIGESGDNTPLRRGEVTFRDDDGSAARFFYVPKTSKKDRNDGLENFTPKATASSEFRPNHAEKADKGENGNPYGRWTPTQNNHPTVKPTDLMRYLVTMVTPKGGTTLDPFMGSGSTGRGAKLGGFNFIGIELDENYLEIAKARIDAISTEVTLEEFFT